MGVPGAGDIILKYTYLGDTDLDGNVTATDFAQLDAAYLNHIYNRRAGDPKATWFLGDLNYDGKIEGSDFAIMDAGYINQMGGASANDPFYAGNLARLGAGYAELVAQRLGEVPEPGTILLLGLGGVGLVGLVGLMGRRRRRR